MIHYLNNIINMNKLSEQSNALNEITMNHIQI